MEEGAPRKWKGGVGGAGVGVGLEGTSEIAISLGFRAWYPGSSTLGPSEMTKAMSTSSGLSCPGLCWKPLDSEILAFRTDFGSSIG